MVPLTRVEDVHIRSPHLVPAKFRFSPEMNHLFQLGIRLTLPLLCQDPLGGTAVCSRARESPLAPDNFDYDTYTPSLRYGDLSSKSTS
jgi:hypothetical protein